VSGEKAAPRSNLFLQPPLSPLRSRSATSRSALRSRSVVFNHTHSTPRSAPLRSAPLHPISPRSAPLTLRSHPRPSYATEPAVGLSATNHRYLFKIFTPTSNYTAADVLGREQLAIRCCAAVWSAQLSHCRQSPKPYHNASRPPMLGYSTSSQNNSEMAIFVNF